MWILEKTAILKVQVFCNKSWRLRSGMECWASILILIFDTTWTAELSAVLAGGTLPPRKFLVLISVERLSGPQGYWMRKEGRKEGMGHFVISKEPSGNRTQNLPSCGAVRQPTATFSTPTTAILLCLILFLNVIAVLLGASSVEICSIFRNKMLSLMV